MLISDTPGGILAKWAVINSFWVAIVAASWNQGWISYIFTKDVTFISHGIATVGAIVLVMTFFKAWNLSTFFGKINSIRETYSKAIKERGEEHRSDLRESLQIELMAYNSTVEFFASAALAVGVLGTVIGLVMGFSNLVPEALADISNIGPAVSQLLVGLSVAFHTTLVGGIVNLWLRTNHYILTQSSMTLFGRVMEG